MLRISWLFASLDISPQIMFGSQNEGNSHNQDMAKIQNTSEIHPTLSLTEFDIPEKYHKNFNASFCVSV